MVTTELQTLCGRQRTVPARYKLEGVVREGDYSHRISRVIEIRKGRYKDGMVALKVLNVSLQDPHILTFKRVSMPRSPPVERFSLQFSRTTAVLQGSSVSEAA